MIKRIIYVDMDDVLCDFTKSYKKVLAEDSGIRYPQSQYGFFRNLTPIKGGIAAVNYLNKQDFFEVYILTAPSVLNPLCYTEKRLWIEDHFGMDMVSRLIISPNKGLNKGDYLIDDHNTGRGQEGFEGKLLQFGTENFQDWVQILAFFKKKYELM